MSEFISFWLNYILEGTRRIVRLSHLLGYVMFVVQIQATVLTSAWLMMVLQVWQFKLWGNFPPPYLLQLSEIRKLKVYKTRRKLKTSEECKTTCHHNIKPIFCSFSSFRLYSGRTVICTGVGFRDTYASQKGWMEWFNWISCISNWFATFHPHNQVSRVVSLRYIRLNIQL